MTLFYYPRVIDDDLDPKNRNWWWLSPIWSSPRGNCKIKFTCNVLIQMLACIYISVGSEKGKGISWRVDDTSKRIHGIVIVCSHAATLTCAGEFYWYVMYQTWVMWVGLSMKPFKHFSVFPNFFLPTFRKRETYFVPHILLHNYCLTKVKLFGPGLHVSYSLYVKPNDLISR
jgi:hypothetical protein